MADATPQLPEFELAPLQSIDPARVVSRSDATRFEMFMLALALFYNDWKGLAWFKSAILKPQPPPTEITAYGGQVAGLSIQFSRLQIGALHEFMKLLQEEREVVEGREVTNLVALIPKDSRDAWKSLVSIALGKGRQREPLAIALERIRNGLAFHYYQPKALTKGFQRSFFELNGRLGSEAAYYSSGESLEQTRFYYADAAATSAMV
ncbi:MAG TPA: hypothetical protein VHP33_28590, partial [Polyangiaceae bacterium]|nr:hypothetical protein [Polyangiaceae bacterium]